MGALTSLAFVAFFVSRQLVPRPLSGFAVPFILGLLGAGECGAFLVGGGDRFAEVMKGQLPFTPVISLPTLIVAGVGSLVFGAAFAIARAFTFRTWIQDGRIWRKGSALTIALWIASLAVHGVYNAIVSREAFTDATFGDFGSATLMFYFGFSLFAQRIVLAARRPGPLINATTARRG